MTGGHLLLEFDRHGRKFADGFECGRVWALLREYPASEVSEVVHARNAEMFMRYASVPGECQCGENWWDARAALTSPEARP